MHKQEQQHSACSSVIAEAEKSAAATDAEAARVDAHRSRVAHNVRAAAATEAEAAKAKTAATSAAAAEAARVEKCWRQQVAEF